MGQDKFDACLWMFLIGYCVRYETIVAIVNTNEWSEICYVFFGIVSMLWTHLVYLELPLVLTRFLSVNCLHFSIHYFENTIPVGKELILSYASFNEAPSLRISFLLDKNVWSSNV